MVGSSYAGDARRDVKALAAQVYVTTQRIDNCTWVRSELCMDRGTLKFAATGQVEPGAVDQSGSPLSVLPCNIQKSRRLLFLLQC
jgi:hypothetical protein